jgi:hypothetical protein
VSASPHDDTSAIADLLEQAAAGDKGAEERAAAWFERQCAALAEAPRAEARLRWVANLLCLHQAVRLRSRFPNLRNEETTIADAAKKRFRLFLREIALGEPKTYHQFVQLARKITRFTMLDLKKKQDQQAQSHVPMDQRTEAKAVRGRGPGEEAPGEQPEKEEAVWRKVRAALDPNQFFIFVLRTHSELTYSRIGAILDQTERQVQYAFEQAMEALGRLR